MSDPFDAAGTEEVKFDRYGRYMLPHPTKGGGLVPWTRVTTFARAAADDHLLQMWKQRMVVKGLAMRKDLYALAVSTPLEERATLNKVAKDAMEAAGASARANLGTALHGLTEVADQDPDEALAAAPDELVPDIKAYLGLVRDAGLEFVATEQRVVNLTFGIAGTFDRLVRRQGEKGTFILDLKTGRSLDFGGLEFATQFACYATADYIWDGPPYPGTYRSMPADIRTDIAYLLHLPVGEACPTLHEVQLDPGYEAAQVCAQVRRVRRYRYKDLVNEVPVAPRTDNTDHEVIDGEVVQREIDMSPFEEFWADKIRHAESRNDLSRIWRAARARGQWTPQLEALGKQHLKEIGA